MILEDYDITHYLFVGIPIMGDTLLGIPMVTTLKVVTFKLEPELLEKLDDFARRKGVTRSEVIRRAIELYLRLEGRRATPEPKFVRLTS